MAFQLTDTALNLAAQVNKEVQIILEIEGISTIFGAIPVEKQFRYDDGVTYDSGVRYDSSVIDENSKPYIMINDSTNAISQQISPDKGGTTSLSVMNIGLLDKNSETSKILAFDANGEILSKKADVYLNFKGGSHREDSLPIFRGYVSAIDYASGLVVLEISHPEKLKRQDVLTQMSTELTAAINNSETVLQVKSTASLISSQDILTTYIRIDDELMEVSSIDSDVQLTVIRAQLNTVANSHDDEGEVVSFYRLQGNPLDVACKVMLSNEGNTFTDITSGIIAFNEADSGTIFNNSIIYEDYNIQELLGLTVNDSLTITGSASNDGTYLMSAFGVFSGGSYITVDGILNDETTTGVTTSYRSQFNTLSFGAEMLPREVDVQAHLDLRDQQGANFVEYDFYIKEDLSAKDWIDTEVYYPQALYSIPRKARASVKLTQPPVTSEVTTTIDETICTNIKDLRVRRSVDVYRYNEFVYNYNVDSLEDKFLKREILISQSSKNRVKAGTKQFKINSNGLRDNAETELVIRRGSDRLNDRYRFAAASIKGLKLPYGFGYALEVGDVVPFGGDGVQINNGDAGERGLEVKLYEIINKSLSIINGEIKIDLLETNFSNNTRYAVISCASKVLAGSTTSELLVEDYFSTTEFTSQGEKWLEFVGERVQVKDDDWDNYEITTLDSVSSQNANKLILDPPLSFIPGDGFTVETVNYDDSSDEIDSDYKLKFMHINSTAVITSVVDAKTFDVDDGTLLAVGSAIYVHSENYDRDSFGVDEVTIDSISVNTITLSEDLSFTPLIDDLVEASDYHDGGNYYAFN